MHGAEATTSLEASTVIRQPTLFVTGPMGTPSWPTGALDWQKQALPRAATRRQVKADARLASKGGPAYLKTWRSRGA